MCRPNDLIKSGKQTLPHKIQETGKPWLYNTLVIRLHDWINFKIFEGHLESRDNQSFAALFIVYQTFHYSVPVIKLIAHKLI